MTRKVWKSRQKLLSKVLARKKMKILSKKSSKSQQSEPSVQQQQSRIQVQGQVQQGQQRVVRVMRNGQVRKLQVVTSHGGQQKLLGNQQQQVVLNNRKVWRHKCVSWADLVDCSSGSELINISFFIACFCFLRWFFYGENISWLPFAVFLYILNFEWNQFLINDWSEI